ncbi:baculoviral IAP repeat-containing protein 7-B-like [Babylonia areolata]|uniref:baculoviral IAP repeat-containing protein 7-B-like n=1 Tax=Babylonia areolata TaxID=304850 RepID=UPI003FD6A93E
MDDGGGRDIAPDEERLNYVYLQNGDSDLENDLEEDTASVTPRAASFLSNSYHFRSRHGFDVQEPVDTTPDTVPVHTPSRRTVSNASDYQKSEENRLSSFSDWRYQHVVRKEDLARNGFMYTGSGDKVRCVYCNGVLRQWDQGDDVEQEHRRNFANCPFLSGENVGNIPLAPGRNVPDLSRSFNSSTARSTRVMNGGHDIDPVEAGYLARYSDYHSQVSPNDDCHKSDAVGCGNNTTGADVSPRRVYSNTPRNPSMSVEPDRLATFGSWPAQMKQKPDKLAQAGLYYLGDGDKVKCFYCDGLLYNWEPEDDPFVEHVRWFPDCQYMKLVKGERFVEEVKSGRPTQDEVMQTPAVLAVLYEGHSMESVQRALAAMRQKNGASMVVTAQDLLATILEMEEDVAENATMNGNATSEDLNKLRMENESLRDKQLCKICMERDVEVIFLPCKHFVCCAPCSAALRSCPICRVAIESVDKVFMV